MDERRERSLAFRLAPLPKTLGQDPLVRRNLDPVTPDEKCQPRRRATLHSVENLAEVRQQADVPLERNLGLVDAQAEVLGVVHDTFREERLPVQVEDEVERRGVVGSAELVLQRLE